MRLLKKAVIQPDVKQELMWVKSQIEVVNTKMAFTNEAKLLDSLSYELLALKSPMGYLIELAKKEYE